MSCLGKILAGVVFRCLPRGSGFGVSFNQSINQSLFQAQGRVFVLHAWYQHLMPNQQHQRTEGAS